MTRQQPTQSQAREYIAPVTCGTGRTVYQPRVEDTQTCWYFDAAYNYQETGFLDAPSYVPTGSVRAVDTPRLTIGVTHDARILESRA